MPDRLSRHQVLLYEGDMERLRQIHTGKLTPTAVIRNLVRAHCDRTEILIAQRLKEMDDAERQAS